LFVSFREAVGYLFTTYSSSKSYRFAQYDQYTRTPWHTRELLDRIGSPDRQIPNLLVTGSKGKGSTSRLLASLLQSQGLRVGLFTSPHLIDFTERIRVSGCAIDEDDFVRILDAIRPVADELAERFALHEYFGPVGLTAVVAALYFAEQHTDVNVLELGRGARFDDVNQLAGSLAVITPVQWEHADCLGPHLSDIAWHKAGVMRAGMKAVLAGRQTAAVRAVFPPEATPLSLPLDVFDREFTVSDVEVSASGTKCTVTTPFARYQDLQLGLLGRNQADNAALAIAAAERYLGGALQVQGVREALMGLQIPGRCQLLNLSEAKPKVLIDGAINADSAGYLAEIIDRLGVQRVISVIGVPSEKDYEGVLATLAPRSQSVIMTVAQNPHLQFPVDAAAKASVWCPASTAHSADEAIAQALALAGDAEGLVVIAGTQSLVAEALAYFHIPTRHCTPFSSDS